MTLALAAAVSPAGEAAVPPPGGEAPATRFAAAISVDYEGGKPLRAWEATCEAIRATLVAWQGGSPLQSVCVATNPTPAALQAFLAGLSPARTGGFQVVYFGARHTRTGAWQFTRKADGLRDWDSLLPAPAGPQPGRVVILDVCHAAAVAEQPVWRAALAPAATLLASTRDEWTYEFDFTRRQPIDLSGRYPAAAAWLRQHLPANWDGRLSNLGVVWVLAYLQTPQAPQTVREWQAFLGRCEAAAAMLRKGLGMPGASTVGPVPAVP